MSETPKDPAEVEKTEKKKEEKVSTPTTSTRKKNLEADVAHPVDAVEKSDNSVTVKDTPKKGNQIEILKSGLILGGTFYREGEVRENSILHGMSEDKQKSVYGAVYFRSL